MQAGYGLDPGRKANDHQRPFAHYAGQRQVSNALVYLLPLSTPGVERGAGGEVRGLLLLVAALFDRAAQTAHRLAICD